jgi:transcriptional regulator with XRE-family HTH domain
MRYLPPTTDDLRRLKDDLGLTGEQMAELFGLAGGQQWRKYTGGAEPREMGLQMLFFAAARLVLDPQQVDRVLARMRQIGAEVNPESVDESVAGA